MIDVAFATLIGAASVYMIVQCVRARQMLSEPSDEEDLFEDESAWSDLARLYSGVGLVLGTLGLLVAAMIALR
ncbi:MAG: hypothetical protein AAGK21_13445 [Bacteroidota bacterium]